MLPSPAACTSTLCAASGVLLEEANPAAKTLPEQTIWLGIYLFATQPLLAELSSCMMVATVRALCNTLG